MYCLVRFGRSQESRSAQPCHQVRELGKEVDALPLLHPFRIDEVEARVVADQSESLGPVPPWPNHEWERVADINAIIS